MEEEDGGGRPPRRASSPAGDEEHGCRGPPAPPAAPPAGAREPRPPSPGPPSAPMEARTPVPTPSSPGPWTPARSSPGHGSEVEARIMDPKEKLETTGGPPPPRLDCIKCFDALWFCYSPVHQMQSYYRYGEFDNCFSKWGALVDCLTLKTKRAAEVEEILIAREKAKPHIWTFRTVDEASEHWWRMYKHVVMMSPWQPRAASPPPKSGDS